MSFHNHPSPSSDGCGDSESPFQRIPSESVLNTEKQGLKRATEREQHKAWERSQSALDLKNKDMNLKMSPVDMLDYDNPRLVQSLPGIVLRVFHHCEMLHLIRKIGQNSHNVLRIFNNFKKRTKGFTESLETSPDGGY